MNLFKESTLTFVTVVIANISYFIIGVIIARVLGPLGKGTWAIMFLIVDYIALVSNLGLDAASVYYLGRDKGLKDHIFSLIVCAWVVIGLLSVCVSVPALMFWGDTIFARGAFDLRLAVWAAAIAPLTSGLRLVRTYFQGCLQIDKYNLVILMQLVLQVIGLYLLLVVLGWGIWGVFISYGLSLLLANGVGIGVVLSEGTTFRFSKGLSVATNLFRFGLRGYLGNMIQFLNYKMDLFLVNVLIGVSSTGIYSVAINLAGVCWFISYAMSVSLFPRVSAAVEDSRKLIAESARICLALTTTAAVILAAGARPLISFFYGSAFAPAAEAVYFLLPGVVIFVYGRILANYFLGKGRPLINSAIGLASLTVNLSLNLLLIPRIGIRGAALATTIAYTVTSVVSYFVFRYYPQKLARVSMPDLFLQNIQETEKSSGNSA